MVRRLVPLAALVVVFVGEVLELRARGAAHGAYERLNRAYGTEGESAAIEEQEIQQIVGRPCDEFDRGTGLMIFRWPGAPQELLPVCPIREAPAALLRPRFLFERRPARSRGAVKPLRAERSLADGA